MVSFVFLILSFFRKLFPFYHWYLFLRVLSRGEKFYGISLPSYVLWLIILRRRFPMQLGVMLVWLTIILSMYDIFILMNLFPRLIKRKGICVFFFIAVITIPDLINTLSESPAEGHEVHRARCYYRASENWLWVDSSFEVAISRSSKNRKIPFSRKFLPGCLLPLSF